MKFAIASEVAEGVVAHARAEHPREACGLLLGTPGSVTHAEPACNVSRSPERNFEIDPSTLLRVHREARGQGLAVVGHYHSHPGGSAEPSRTDAARAVEDGQLWLIVTGTTVTGWLATADGALHGRFITVELG